MDSWGLFYSGCARTGPWLFRIAKDLKLTKTTADFNSGTEWLDIDTNEVLHTHGDVSRTS